MTLLVNLDETIKTKNQENEKTRYLAICEEFIEADNNESMPWVTPYRSRQAWVIVNQNATLVFFLNTNFKVGVFGNDDNTSYSEGVGCKKVLSLDKYIDEELKKNTRYNYLNRTIETFLDTKINPIKSEKGPEGGGWGKVAHELFEEFKKRYIHKFIAHTYNEDYIKNIDKLYEFYVLVYEPLVGDKYITNNCSPVFKYYIIMKQEETFPTFIKINKDKKNTSLFPETRKIDNRWLRAHFFDIKQKDAIYILESDEFKKFNFYNDPTDLGKDFELFNILDINKQEIFHKLTNALDKLFTKFIEFKRGTENFIIDILNIYQSVIKYHTEDAKKKMINLGVESTEMTLVEDIKSFKLVYVKSENELFYNKNNVYIKFENFAQYIQSREKQEKIDETLFKKFDLEQIWKNDQELKDFNTDEQQKFLEKIRDLKNNLQPQDVRDFVKRFYNVNKNIYKNDPDFHLDYFTFYQEEYINDEFFISDGVLVKLEIIFDMHADGQEVPFIKIQDNQVKLEGLYTAPKQGDYKSTDKICTYIHFINENKDNILSTIAMKSLTDIIIKQLEEEEYTILTLENILSCFHIINDLKSLKGLNEKLNELNKKLINIIINKLKSSKLRDVSILLGEAKIGRGNEATLLDYLRSYITKITENIEYINNNRDALTDIAEVYLELLTKLEGELQKKYNSEVANESQREEREEQKKREQEKGEIQKARDERLKQEMAYDEEVRKDKLKKEQQKREDEQQKHEDRIAEIHLAKKEEIERLRSETEVEIARIRSELELKKKTSPEAENEAGKQIQKLKIKLEAAVIEAHKDTSIQEEAENEVYKKAKPTTDDLALALALTS